MIKNLKDINTEEAHLAGGKSASLAFLANNLKDVKTPTGFGIFTDFQDEYFKSINLIPCTENYENTQKLILDGLIPQHLKTELKKHYELLMSEIGQDNIIAVRSSANLEDGKKHSFAGQHDSILDVKNYDELEQAIKSVIASLYSKRAIQYRARKEIPEATIKMAITVQELIRADLNGCAGVMFTKDPDDIEDGNIIIESCYGLGESVVNGSTIPKSQEISQDLSNIHHSVGNQHIKTIISNGSLQSIPTTKQEKDIACLDAFLVKELAEIGLQIEKTYGFPADVEWAYKYETQEFYIVQIRPVIF